MKPKIPLFKSQISYSGNQKQFNYNDFVPIFLKDLYDIGIDLLIIFAILFKIFSLANIVYYANFDGLFIQTIIFIIVLVFLWISQRVNGNPFNNIYNSSNTKFSFNPSNTKISFNNHVDSHNFNKCNGCGRNIARLHAVCPYCGSRNIKRY